MGFCTYFSADFCTTGRGFQANLEFKGLNKGGVTYPFASMLFSRTYGAFLLDSGDDSVVLDVTNRFV